MTGPDPNPYGYQPVPQPQPQRQPQPQGEPDGYVAEAAQGAHQWPAQEDQQVQYQPYPGAAVQPYQDPTRYGPAYQAYAAPIPAVDPGRTIGIAGLVIGLGCWWIPYLGFVAPILALALGIAGLNRSKRVGIRNNVAIASIVVGAVEIVLGIVAILGLVAFVVAAA